MELGKKSILDGLGLALSGSVAETSAPLEEGIEDTLAEAQSFDKRTRLLFENDEVAQADVVKAGTRRAATAPR